MALAATSVCEIRNGGSDTNAGWFDAALGGVDYTLQTSPQATITADLSASGTTTLTATTSPFTSQMVGNCVRISGGTLTAGLYQITAYTDANNVTLDRTPGTGSGSDGVIGGALASLGQAGSDCSTAGTDGLIIYIKYSATPYDFASTSSNVSGGKFTFTRTGKGRNPHSIVGYDTNRTLNNTDDNRPTLRAMVATLGGMINIGAYSVVLVRNLVFNGNRASYSGANGASVTDANGAAVRIVRCRFTGFSHLNGATGAMCHEYCEFDDGVNVVFPGTQKTANFFRCIFRSISTSAQTLLFAHNTGGSHSFFIECLFYGNGDGTADANVEVRNNRMNLYFLRCVFYNISGSGIYCSNNNGSYAPQVLIDNCIFASCSRYGVEGQLLDTYNVRIMNCAFWNNTLGDTTLIASECIVNKISLTGNPFVDAANGNFALNNTAGAGAACRNAGIVTFPLGLTTGYTDVGAAQHQDAGSGGLILPIGMNGGYQ